MNRKEVTRRFFNFLLLTHEVRESSNGYYHYNCKHCLDTWGEAEVGRTGILNPSESSISCFQGNCKFNRFTNPINYYQYFHNLDSYKEAVNHLEDNYAPANDLEVGYDVSYRPKAISKEEKLVTFPSSVRSILDSNEQYAKDAIKYLEGRGFDVPFIVDKFKFQFCGEDSEEKYKGSIFMPYFDIYNRMVYFQCRSIDSKTKARYVFPSGEESLYSKSSFLYNERSLTGKSTLFVCEGVFDAIELQKTEYLYNKFASVHVGGSKLTTSHMDIIAKYRELKKIYIMFDPDAYKSAEKACKDLSFRFPNLKIYLVDTSLFGVNDKSLRKDVNDVGYKRALAVAAKTQPYSIPLIGSTKEELENTIEYGF